MYTPFSTQFIRHTCMHNYYVEGLNVLQVKTCIVNILNVDKCVLQVKRKKMEKRRGGRRGGAKKPTIGRRAGSCESIHTPNWNCAHVCTYMKRTVDSYKFSIM